MPLRSKCQFPGLRASADLLVFLHLLGREGKEATINGDGPRWQRKQEITAKYVIVPERPWNIRMIFQPFLCTKRCQLHGIGGGRFRPPLFPEAWQVQQGKGNEQAGKRNIKEGDEIFTGLSSL